MSRYSRSYITRWVKLQDEDEEAIADCIGIENIHETRLYASMQESKPP